MHVRRRAAALLAVTGLTAMLLPLSAGAVQADPSGPAFGYVTYAVDGVHTSTTDKLWATSPGDLAAATALTPDHYVYRYDVSEDGNVLATTGQSRSLAVPGANTTYGVLVTARDPLNPASVTTRLVAHWFDSNPVVSRDGAYVYWFDGPLILKYVVASGELVDITSASARFPALPGEVVLRLSISADGTKAAVVYGTFDQDGNLIASRIKAANLRTGVGPIYERTAKVTASSKFPVAAVLTWKPDGSGFLYSRSTLQGDLTTVSAKVEGGDATVPGFDGMYDLRSHGGTWYMFRENGSPAVTQVGSSATLAVPTDWTTFPLGATTVRYAPATLTPPVEVPTTGRGYSEAKLLFAKSVLPVGQRTVYASLASYNNVVGGLQTDNPLATRYGVLSYSTDGGATFTSLGRTGVGSSYLPWPNAAPFGNGYTPVIKRNTVFRWCFEGDAYVEPDCVRKSISAVPTISLVTQQSGSKVTVYGKATRVGGSAGLYRYIYSEYRLVAKAAISSTGRFNFGTVTLRPGTYRVLTAKDAGWA
ncbi:hypothetical protein, partial [Longivirga aurantiaca]